MWKKLYPLGSSDLVLHNGRNAMAVHSWDTVFFLCLFSHKFRNVFVVLVYIMYPFVKTTSYWQVHQCIVYILKRLMYKWFGGTFYFHNCLIVNNTVISLCTLILMWNFATSSHLTIWGKHTIPMLLHFLV